MQTEITPQQWNALSTVGHLRVEGAIAGPALAELEAVVQSLLDAYPHGFDNPPNYSGLQPTPRPAAPKPTDNAPTVIIPNVGFLAPDLLKPLANPVLHALLERVVGKDFYLNNSWFQMVPPGTGRMAYHKDARGSITFNILLDDIEPKMGSTCLVPGTHVNTPPPAYCMRNIQLAHPSEVDMAGKRGDLVLFSGETWHARAENTSNRSTRRLFYNFFSRSSRATTAWNGVVSEAQLAAARAVLPAAHHHMLRIDPDQTRQLSTVKGGALKRWGLAASASSRIVRDAVFQWSVYGRSVGHADHPGFLLPYTTRLVEQRPFSSLGYLSHFKPLPTAINMARFVQQRALATIRRTPAPAAVMAD